MISQLFLCAHCTTEKIRFKVNFPVDSCLHRMGPSKSKSFCGTEHKVAAGERSGVPIIGAKRGMKRKIREEGNEGEFSNENENKKCVHLSNSCAALF